jgi:hypothetical protein
MLRGTRIISCRRPSLTLYAFGVDNGLYLMIAAPFALSVYVLFRYWLKVSFWHMNDLLFVVLPGTVYWALDESFRLSKTLANGVIEPFIVAILCGVLFLARALIGKYRPGQAYLAARIYLIFIFIIPLSVYLLTPFVPE